MQSTRKTASSSMNTLIPMSCSCRWMAGETGDVILLLREQSTQVQRLASESIHVTPPSKIMSANKTRLSCEIEQDSSLNQRSVRPIFAQPSAVSSKSDSSGYVDFSDGRCMDVSIRRSQWRRTLSLGKKPQYTWPKYTASKLPSCQGIGSLFGSTNPKHSKLINVSNLHRRIVPMGVQVTRWTLAADGATQPPVCPCRRNVFP